MYEDVIKLVKTDMETRLEGEIMQAVLHVGVEVNKEELIRALAYDRGQYEKGLRDGQPKWISVKERLPENTDDVLMATDAGVSIGFYDIYCCEWVDYTNDDVKCVTHWVPLPEPPEEEE